MKTEEKEIKHILVVDHEDNEYSIPYDMENDFDYCVAEICNDPDAQHVRDWYEHLEETYKKYRTHGEAS